MIDQINLTDLSVNQLVVIYNHINERDVDGYNKQKAKHDILRIKKKLINIDQLSEYVLEYEGKL